MKSAYELAMEKLGETRQYTEEEKERLAEIDAKYEAKKAEAKFQSDKRLGDAEDEAGKEAVWSDLAAEISSLEEKKEREKEEIRKTQL